MAGAKNQRPEPGSPKPDVMSDERFDGRTGVRISFCVEPLLLLIHRRNLVPSGLELRDGDCAIVLRDRSVAKMRKESIQVRGSGDQSGMRANL